MKWLSTAQEAGGADCSGMLAVLHHLQVQPAHQLQAKSLLQAYFDRKAMLQVSCQPAAWTLVLAVGTAPA